MIIDPNHLLDLGLPVHWAEETYNWNGALVARMSPCQRRVIVHRAATATTSGTIERESPRNPPCSP